VVSARRTVRPGTVRVPLEVVLEPPDVAEGAQAAQFRDLGRQLQRDAAARQDHGRVAQAHAVRLELQRDAARGVLGHRHRELAADQELAGSPDTTVRLGSARVRTRPTRSNAWIMPLAEFRPGLPAVLVMVAVSPLP
jgi:hypothetical protein